MNLLSAASTAVDWLCNLLYFVQGYLFYQILCSTAQKRPGKIWSLILYGSCIPLTNMIIFPNDLFNVTLELVWFLALMLAAFRGSIWQKLAAVAILYPLIISQNFLILDMLGNLWLALGKSPVVDLFCSVADSALYLASWYMVCQLFKKRLRQMDRLFDDKSWILLDIICLASMVNITTCIYFSPQESYKMWPAALACFATNLGSLFLAEYFTASIRQNMELKNLMLQKSYYEELEQNQTQIRRFRHDMNNHLSAIRSLFQSGNQAEAERYLEEMETRMAVQNRVFCKNSVVNAVLNAKYNLALEHKIDCFFHIDLQRLIGIDAISLCSLFSNTLDNAIEASLKIPDPRDRSISVKARVTENGFFTYEITNAKINEISEQKGVLQSDKKEPSSHGLGLLNVKEAVEKYNGSLDISYTKDSFTVTILIGNV